MNNEPTTVEPIAAPATAPVEPTASATEPTIAAPVNPAPTGGDKDWTVPGDRLLDETRKRQELEQRLAEMEARQATAPVVDEAPGFDPEVSKSLDAWAKQHGLVSKKELEEDRMAVQAQQDLRELKEQHRLSDDQIEQVRKQAVEMGAANRKGLEAAYFVINKDAIIEAEVKKALAGGPTATAEKPGAGGGGKPSSEQPAAGASLKERIRAAASRVTTT